MKRPWFLFALCLVGCSASVQVFTGSDAGLDAGDVSPDAQDPGPDAAVPDIPADATLDEPDAASPPTSTADSLGLGLAHTCVVLDGALHCWGFNSYGELGLGDTAPRQLPQRVGSAADWEQVSAGERHSCGLRSDLSVHCWGSNSEGELGQGDRESRLAPTEVPGPTGGWVRVACGGRTSCGLSADGGLFCWGDNEEGTLGQGDPFMSPDALEPVAVMAEQRFTDVALGQGHVCAIDRDGKLWCWGRNTMQQLGLGDDTGQIRAPRRVGTRSNWLQVSAGQSHTCAINTEGRLFCWGGDSFGSLGFGPDKDSLVRVPVQVGDDADWSSVRVRWFHSCGRRGGQAFCWGRGIEGQGGHGDFEAKGRPERVGMHEDWSDLAVARFHTCGFRAEGLFCWGENADTNPLGVPLDDGRQGEPARITLPPGP